jgi:hypothetical protein
MAAAGVSFLGIHDAAAQRLDWALLFGTSLNDYASAATTDPNGNVYVAGATEGRFPGETRARGGRDPYLRKFDSALNEVWTRQFGSIGDDWARAVAVDHEGNILVAGEAAEDIPGKIRVSGYGGAYVRKFGAGGNELWMRHFGIRQFSQANGVAVDRDGNVFLTGQIVGALPGQSGSGGTDAFLRAYDKNGEELWTRQFGKDGRDFASAVAVDGDGDVYVVGSDEVRISRSGRPVQRLITPFVRKFDSAGSLVWTHPISTTGFARATAAAVDNVDNLYVAGWISGALMGRQQVGHTDAFILKFDQEGKELWTQQFGTNKEDRALGVGVDIAGNPYVVGWTRGLFPGQTGLEPRTNLVHQDAFIRKYDRLGNEVWTRQVGSKLIQSANSATAAGSGVYVVGQTAGPLLGQRNSGVLDAFLLKLAGGLPSDTTMATARASTPEIIPGRTVSVDPTEARTTQTPLPAATAKPSLSAPEAATVAPAAKPPPGGSCSPSGGTHVGVGWLLPALLVPGLLLVRRQRSSS